MGWYSVLLHGENYLMKMGLFDKQRVRGFWTTRFVEADSRKSAELAAVALIRSDPFLQKAVRNPRDDSPMIYAEKIQEIEPRTPGDHGAGYTFYSD